MKLFPHIKYLLVNGCSLLLIVSLMSVDASAQVHRIEVGEGRVLIDGKALSSSALPASFDADAVRASFLLESTARVYLRSDGFLYEVSAEGIREVGRTDQMIALGGPPASEGGIPVRRVSDDPSADNRADISMIEQAEVLRERARELQRLSFELQESRMQSNQLFDMIESIHRSAAETERVARSLPHIQAQRYMHEMRERNTELYERLVHEQSLDRETLELSSRIRELNDGSQRTDLVNRLRALLVESLQMKQDNRRQEIGELEERLSSLQRRHERRERHFDHIVNRRLNELIGIDDEEN